MTMPISAASAAWLVYNLAPVLREPVVALVNAIKSSDEDAARKALEAALRAAFVARQK
jgi:hypothetical protein